MSRFIFLFSTIVAIAGLASCHESQEASAEPTPPASTNLSYYEVKGVVKSLDDNGRSVTIKHEEVKDYMPAMTMPFDVKNTNELRGLKAGDAVTFRLVVIPDQDAWIDHVQKLVTEQPARLPSRGSFRIVREVEPLNFGDALPEYHFTNELGQAVATSQFKGQALAFTFFFTRCPFPTFCPLMTRNFEEAQNKLLSIPGGPTNWHLLSISFDPEIDSPAVLKAYAERYHYDPARWSFVTGTLIDLTAIAEQVGENFWHDPDGSINHNLRTVVIDAQGKLQIVMTNNAWTSDDLVKEMVKAADARPRTGN